MAGFVDYPLTVDPAAIVQQALAHLRTATGATLNEGHPLVALIEAITYRNAETRIITADVARAIYRDHGRKVYGVAPIDPAPASAETTWTAADSAGYTIPAGTRVAYPVTGDRRVAFAVVEETVIPPGSLTATGVVVEAILNGASSNDLPAASVVLVDPLVWVASVATTTTTSGGADGETDTAYVDRLTSEIRAASTGGLVLAEDYETAARRVAGVHRALAIDGYEPTGETFNNERTVTVALVDADGVAVSGAVKTAVEAELESRREVNFIVHVIDPTFTAVTVTFTAVARDGFDLVETEAAAEAAVATYLDPGTWAGGDESPPAWRNQTVRYLEVAAVINAVEGVDYVSALTLNGGTADVNLSGVAPLPDPTVTGTVV